MKEKDISVVVMGLGYVGLPLAVCLSNIYSVIGFDKKRERIEELKKGLDKTGEVNENTLKSVSENIVFTNEIDKIRNKDLYIVAVPTPIKKSNVPDLAPLRSASQTVAAVMGKGAIVVYESTVFPGCTEEFCIPIIEKESGLVFNKDFFAGYSPERINPGDKVHTIDKIVKVTSGSTPETADFIDSIYASVISAGTFRASSIRVAEAAKVIENTQRDLNIAFVNELAIMFEKMDIDTIEVLEAAGSKWNFLNFRPGLVGGHCIGVDPYYLTHKAQEIGHHPELILAGRRLNDSMGDYVATQVVRGMIQKGHTIYSSRLLVMGVTFKENCPDIRNSRVIDIISGLKSFNCQVDVYDPLADSEEVRNEYRIELISKIKEETYNGIVLAVAHEIFSEVNIKSLLVENGYIYDVKSYLPKNIVDRRL